jgi:predicted chitinase
MQGEDVYIGEFLTAVAWKEAITKALKQGEYIAQEFSDSMNFLVPDENNEWSPHKLV